MDYLAKGPGQDGKRDAAMGEVLRFVHLAELNIKRILYSDN